MERNEEAAETPENDLNKNYEIGLRWLEAEAECVFTAKEKRNAMRESRIFLLEGKQGKWLEPPEF